MIPLSADSVRQDGDVFHRAAARILPQLELINADLCCGDLGHGGCPHLVVHPMVLEIR